MHLEKLLDYLVDFDTEKTGLLHSFSQRLGWEVCMDSFPKFWSISIMDKTQPTTELLQPILET